MMKDGKLGRNDPCHCGSGKKYKHCHLKTDNSLGITAHYKKVKVPTTVKELDQTTIEFIEYIKDLFGIIYHDDLDRGAVLGSVTKEKIRALYEALPGFFPHRTSFQDICNSVDLVGASGLYWGSPNINSIATYLSRYALYTPRIIVANPFCDMMVYHSEASPLERPEPWAQVTINQALFLISIERWIREGVITVLPPLRWYDPVFHDKEIVPLAKKRIESAKLNDPDGHRQLFIQTAIEHLQQFHPNDIESVVRQFFREDIPEQQIGLFKQSVINEFKKNPIRYKWLTPLESSSAIIKSGSGHSLESLLLTAHLSGSYLLFGERSYRSNYDLACRSESDLQSDQLTEISKAFSELKFSFLNAVRLDYVLSLRKDGRLSEFRSYLVRTWRSIAAMSTPNENFDLKSFKDELESQYEKYKEEWAGIDRAIMKNMSKAVVAGGIAVLSGQFNPIVAMGGVATFGIHQLIDSYDKRKKHRRLPLGIFLELEKKNQS